MDENPHKMSAEPGQVVAPVKKRMPGYHPFEFVRLGWFIAGILFLPLVLLLVWGIMGVLRAIGLL